MSLGYFYFVDTHWLPFIWELLSSVQFLELSLYCLFGHFFFSIFFFRNPYYSASFHFLISFF